MANNETVAKIVREMRNDAIAADAWHETYGEMASAASTLNRHADRIEKAHNREIAAKDAEIAELKDCILKEIDWLKRMIKNELEGWATSMWSPSDRFRKHTFSRLIEDNTYHIDRMEKALKGAEDEKDNP